MLQSWIARELEVDENVINKKSLTSAINRYLKKITLFSKIREQIAIQLINRKYQLW